MIRVGELLVRGGWCEIREIVGAPSRCAKLLIPRRRFKGQRPDPDEIVQAKYNIPDFLAYEWSNYQKILRACPEDLRQYIVEIHGLETTDDGRKALVMDIVLDDRNLVAPNLAKNTRPLSPQFWDALERLRKDVFLAGSIDHFGIVRRNILVKSPDHPVMIDFQTGRERYRGQFWLRHPWFVRQKVNRYFQKLYKEMGVTLP